MLASEFIEKQKSKQTKRAYRWALKLFFSTIYNTNFDDLKDMQLLDSLSQKYLNEVKNQERDHEQDILAFFDAIKDGTIDSSEKAVLYRESIELVQAIGAFLIVLQNKTRETAKGKEFS